jgi:hypothetical protein
MKHTPGPWYWDTEGLGSKDVLVFGKGYPFEMTSKANKNLIAAAPDLLAALQLIISYHDDGNCELHSEDVAMARAAISKALGED